MERQWTVPPVYRAGRRLDEWERPRSSRWAEAYRARGYRRVSAARGLSMVQQMETGDGQDWGDFQ
jgi:hypothetical protein